MAIVVGAGKTDIPVRSLWLLLIYASDMLPQLRSGERESLLAGDHDADLIGAIAEVLVSEVETRIRKQLTFHYQRTSADLTRVRGRINHLRTLTNRLMDQGRIACTYEELTVNSPRNRFVAATLLEASRIVSPSGPDAAASRRRSQRCADAAFAMQRQGVDPRPPSRAELSKDRLGHHDARDRRMLDAAHLVHEMAVPYHERGPRSVPRILRDEDRYRKLFEKAVRGYLRYTLEPAGWTVDSPQLKWRHQCETDAHELLPLMKTDIVLTNVTDKRRIVVETKFTDALVEYHGKTTINRDFIYQIYAYLRSQTGGGDAVTDSSEGVLLFVAANGRPPLDRSVTIQGHPIRFLSVDLADTPNAIRKRWSLCSEPHVTSISLS
jgi:5-methylcytosine-specific restriction enzyme subunit McrC